MNNLQAKFLSLGFLIVTLTVCRNTEVDKAVSPTEGINLVGSLVVGQIRVGFGGGTGGTGGFSGYQVPRQGLRNVGGAAGLLLFGTSFQQPAVWRNGNGSNWEKSTYTIPGCVSTSSADGSNTCTVEQATFNGAAKYYVLVRYSESKRGSDNVFRDSNYKYWLGTGSSLLPISMIFREINVSSLGITNPENGIGNLPFMAANAQGIVLQAQNRVPTENNRFNVTYNYCASSDDGGNWSCLPPDTNFDFVENLDGSTISIGRRARWLTGTGAPTLTGNTSSFSGSPIKIGNRTIMTGNGGIIFTDTSPDQWTNSTTFTNGNNASSLGNSTLIAGASDTPFAVNRTFNNNIQSFTLAKSTDNGLSWTTAGSPNTGFSYDRWETFSVVFANGKYTAVTAGTESTNNFGIRILETTQDPTLGGTWTRVCGGTTSANITCP